ncbi:MAG: aromatic amino acid lyase [Candidatus Wildermuthbacteria bacterium]|nr:aromatic amino acid lyase [Candidatus Wildermuthbacteria bacterium]
MKSSLTLDGNNLTIETIDTFSRNTEISVDIAPSALLKVQNSREFLEKEVQRSIVYGANTGFGPMASNIINHTQLTLLQANLIRSHAVGIGDPLPETYVLAAMLVRLNTLLKGYSGVSPELIRHLQTFINKRILPIIPEHGAVGTSGDLVQLAHIALALTGEGEVMYRKKRRKSVAVLKECGISPYALKPKEGLSLINGTSAMTGIGALLCARAEHILSFAIRFGALSLELVHAFDDSISEHLHNTRPHKGQIEVARRLRSLLESSRMLKKRDELRQPSENGADVVHISETVQEFYSLRCIPQVLGPVLDTLANTKNILETEMNSASDNPIVDTEHKLILHGGNFHGDYVASAVDQLKIALVKLGMLSERRTNFFLNHEINKFFPPFMNLRTPGLTLGLQGLQFVATSTAAQNQTLAFPHYIHSIPTNGDNQDIVSMGTDAALFATKVANNVNIILAVELITLAQAVHFSNNPSELSDSSQKLIQQITEIFPPIIEDRTLVDQLPKVVAFIQDEKKGNV